MVTVSGRLAWLSSGRRGGGTGFIVGGGLAAGAAGQKEEAAAILAPCRRLTYPRCFLSPPGTDDEAVSTRCHHGAPPPRQPLGGRGLGGGRRGAGLRRGRAGGRRGRNGGVQPADGAPHRRRRRAVTVAARRLRARAVPRRGGELFPEPQRAHPQGVRHVAQRRRGGAA